MSAGPVGTDGVRHATHGLTAIKLENGAASGAGSTNGGSKHDVTSIKEAFKAFSRFGDCKSDGKYITLSQSDKWMKQAKVIDGKRITTTDTGIHFKKLKSIKVNLEDYLKFLEDLAKTKMVDLDEIKKKLTSCAHPEVLTHVPRSHAAAAAVDRLTDTSKYTGSHKQRFDDTGKGKGLSGRREVVDASGYVTGYHHKDTYDKSH